MPTVSRFVLACAAGLLLSASGCARACHDSQHYCVDCRYCPPPPLPYTYYNECACHSCAASKHLTIQPSPKDDERGLNASETVE